MKKLSLMVIFSLLFSLGLGCQDVGFNAEPRLRFGSYPTPTIPTTYFGRSLGKHSYSWFSLSEKDGIVYTCKAGHIDIIHVRISADWTAYLATKTFKHLMKKDTEFSFGMKVEPSDYFVKISYPENWEDLPLSGKEKITKEISLLLGQYFTFTAVTWHEILTWFDFHCLGPLPEFPSAFSWEDSFSNLLGTYIGTKALTDTEHSYNEAVTLALDKKLEQLGIQPASVARSAAEKVRGKWFSGHLLFFVDMKKRNFDIGLDGYVTPTLVPNICECEGAEPLSYPSPSLDVLNKYGFSAKFEIEPKEWEKDKILKIVYPDGKGKRIYPYIHFPIIMEHMKKQAIERGYDVDT